MKLLMDIMPVVAVDASNRVNNGKYFGCYAWGDNQGNVKFHGFQKPAVKIKRSNKGGMYEFYSVTLLEFMALLQGIADNRNILKQKKVLFLTDSSNAIKKFETIQAYWGNNWEFTLSYVDTLITQMGYRGLTDSEYNLLKDDIFTLLVKIQKEEISHNIFIQKVKSVHVSDLIFLNQDKGEKALEIATEKLNVFQKLHMKLDEAIKKHQFAFFAI